ncbi:MAG: HD domain-containing protein [Candidatus Asgardarchaeia archaeon]
MCNLKPIKPKIWQFSKSVMSDSFHHGWPHIIRVLQIAKKIQRNEGGDSDVIEIAVLLHDIGRNIERSLNEHHAILSAKISEHLLKNLGVCKSHRDQILHIILSHSFSSGIKPETIEAKIVSDADKIDALGAIGVIRAFLFGETSRRSINDTLNHFMEKLFKLPDLMYTETGKTIARERLRIMTLFYESINKELSPFLD